MADSLAPGFLVASPALRDPGFAGSLIVMVEHGADGSLGFVVNRPASVRFDQVSQILGLEVEEPAGARTAVFVGGPVAPQSGWILYDPEDVEEALVADSVRVSERLAVSASRRLLEQIARGRAPARRLLALGYAGWAAGQLDAELSRGMWIPVDLDDEIVFDVLAVDRWHAALVGAGIDPARMTGLAGFVA